MLAQISIIADTLLITCRLSRVVSFNLDRVISFKNNLNMEMEVFSRGLISA